MASESAEEDSNAEATRPPDRPVPRAARGPHFLVPLVPLLVSAAILLCGNGVLVTLVAVRANLEGFSPSTIGLFGTSYFAGFVVGCLFTARLIAQAGHIRVFAALASAAALTSLILILFVDPWVWAATRAVMGFCFSGLFTVVEAWLNEKAPSSSRGRVLSLYRLIDLGSVTVAQFLLPAIGPEGFPIFAVVAIFFCLAVMPISLSRQRSPLAPERPSLDVGRIWRLSPVACVGCVTVGLTTSAFRTVGPVYAQSAGLSVEQVAVFMTAGIVGGAVLQFPFGWLSDRYDRRWTLLIATVGASLAGLAITLTGASEPFALYAGAFVFGCFAIPLYSLSVAHANDMAGEGDYVQLTATLILFWGLAASVGPFTASLLMQASSSAAFFVYTSFFHILFVAFVLYRMVKRRTAPGVQKASYVPLNRTSPEIFRLARRRNGRGRRQQESEE